MMNIIRRFATAIVFTIVALSATSAGGPARAAETCDALKDHVAKGKKYHGAKCYSANGCDCSVTKCVTDVTLYGTNHKSTVTKYKNAKCENYVKLPNQPNVFPGCKVIEGSINNGDSFHDVKCKDSGGCLCVATKCDNGTYHKVKCWKAPT